MEIRLYSVKDTVAEEFGPIFGAKNDAIANRNFTDILSKTQYPKDFKLYLVGYYETTTGVIDSTHSAPILVDIIDTTAEQGEI